jgi:hypothetical protein
MRREKLIEKGTAREKAPGPSIFQKVFDAYSFK